MKQLFLQHSLNYREQQFLRTKRFQHGSIYWPPPGWWIPNPQLDESLKKVAHISIMRRSVQKILPFQKVTFYAVNMQFCVKAKETWQRLN